MAKKLIAALGKIGTFSKTQIDQILEDAVLKSADIDQVLLEKGQVSQSIFFILEGAMMLYIVNDEMDLEIHDLYGNEDWVVNHQSFTTQKPSTLSLKTYADCIYYELTLYHIHKLIAKSQAFLQLGKVMSIPFFRSQHILPLSSPEEKYKVFLEHKPSYIQQFPLKLIASYLRITPESLSRLRKKMASPSLRID